MIKPKDLYLRLIRDTYQTLTDNQARRIVQFRWILKILILFLVVASLATLITQEYTIHVLTICLAVCFFFSYWLVYFLKYRGVLIVSSVMTIVCAGIYSYVLINGTSDGFSAIWILIMPPISILLMGRKVGTISNSVLFLVLVFLLWTPWGNSLLKVPYSPVFKSRIPIIYILLYVIMMLAETLRDITMRQLLDSRKRMEAIYQLQYSDIHERIEEARKSRHDLRHHLLILDSYLKENNLEDAKNYIQQYYQSLPFEEAMIFCDHYGTNALLTYCSQRAKHENVEKQIHVQFPKELPFPDEDLTIIFGNLLENALNASVAGMNEDSDFVPKVTVTGSFNGSMLMFSVKNHALHQATQNAEHVFLSTKHPGSGIGLASVRGVVEKYDGILKIEQENGEFSATVIMYPPK